MNRQLHFNVAGRHVGCAITSGYNAGYTGRDQQTVEAHITELAEQGIQAPGHVPTLFSVPTYMNLQVDRVEVEHAQTSGEVEWALIHRGHADPDLLTVASDHTDRALEAYDVTSAKQITPNVLGAQAWELGEISAGLDDIVMRSRVSHAGEWTLLQEGMLGDLISPMEWLDRLQDAGRLRPGVVVLGGTVPMLDSQKQFADRWEVSLERPDGALIVKSYDVHRMVPSIA